MKKLQKTIFAGYLLLFHLLLLVNISFAQPDSENIKQFLINKNLIVQSDAKHIQFTVESLADNPLQEYVNAYIVKSNSYPLPDRYLIVEDIEDNSKLYLMPTDFNYLMENNNIQSDFDLHEIVKFFILFSYPGEGIQIESLNDYEQVFTHITYNIQAVTWSEINGIRRKWNILTKGNQISTARTWVLDVYADEYIENKGFLIPAKGYVHYLSGKIIYDDHYKKRIGQRKSNLQYNVKVVMEKSENFPFDIGISSDKISSNNTKYLSSRNHVLITNNEKLTDRRNRQIKIQLSQFPKDHNINCLVKTEKEPKSITIYNYEMKTDSNGEFDSGNIVFENKDNSGLYQVSISESGKPTNIYKTVYFYVYNSISDELHDGYNYQIFYCDQFTNYSKVKIESFSEKLGEVAKDAYLKLIIQWEFPSPEKIEYNTPKTMDIFVIDHGNAFAYPIIPINNKFRFDKIEIGYPHIQKKVKKYNYTEKNALRGTFSHELFHAAQYSTPNMWFSSDSDEWDYIIEGQARFYPTIYMEYNSDALNNGEFDNSKSLFARDANDFLKSKLKTSLKEVSYDYALFWRFLYENYLPNYSTKSEKENLNIIKKILESTDKVGLDPIIDGELALDNALSSGGGKFFSFDQAIMNFAEYLLYIDPNPAIKHWGKWHDPSLIYQKPKYVYDEKIDINNFKSSSFTSTIVHSFGIDLLTFDLKHEKSSNDDSSSNTQLEFEFQVDSPDFGINVVVFDSSPRLDTRQQIYKKGNNYYYCVKNQDLNKRISFSICRLDTKEDELAVSDCEYRLSWEITNKVGHEVNAFIACLNKNSNLCGATQEDTVSMEVINKKEIYMQKYKNGSIIFNDTIKKYFWIEGNIYKFWIQEELLSKIGLPIEDAFSSDWSDNSQIILQKFQKGVVIYYPNLNQCYEMPKKIFQQLKLNYALEYLGSQKTVLNSKANIIEFENGQVKVNKDKITIIYDKTKQYKDFSSDSWYAKYINYGISKGFFSCYESQGTNFLPNEPVLRKEMAKIITLAAIDAKAIRNFDESGEPFVDVPKNNPYFKYIQTLKNYNIVSGYAGGSFGPDEKLTRGEMTKFLVKAFNFEIIDDKFKRITEQMKNEDGFRVFCQYIITLMNTKVPISNNSGTSIFLCDGYGNGLFGINNYLKRSEISKFIILSYFYKTRTFNPSPSQNTIIGRSIQPHSTTSESDLPVVDADNIKDIITNDEEVFLSYEDFHNNDYEIFWTASSGKLVAMDDQFKSIKFIPPEVKEATEVEFYSRLVDAAGNFVEKLFSIIVNPKASITQTTIHIEASIDPSETTPKTDVLVKGTATYSTGAPVSNADLIISTHENNWRSHTNNDGSFSCSIQSPESSGNVNIRVDDGEYQSDYNKFLKIKNSDIHHHKKILITADYEGSNLKAGQPVKVFGNATYDSGDPVNSGYVTIQSSSKTCNIELNQQGNFSCEIIVPEYVESVTIKVTDGVLSNSTTISLGTTVLIADSIDLSFTISPEVAKPGDDIQISGKAMYDSVVPVINQKVEITIRDKTWDAYLDDNGDFSITVTAPDLSDYVILYISDGTFVATDEKYITVDTDLKISKSEICKQITNDNEYLPLGMTQFFRSDDEQVVSWVELNNVQEEFKIKWKWFLPNGDLLNEHIEQFSDSSPNKYVRLYSSKIIRSYNISKHAGKHYVKIYYAKKYGDFQYYSKDTFVMSYIFDTYRICKQLNNEKPVHISKKFDQTDRYVYNWIQFQDITEEIHLKTEWLEPNGSLYKTTYKKITDPGKNHQYTEKSVYTRISLQDKNILKKCGKWKIVQYKQNPFGEWDYLYKDTFVYEETPAVNPTIDAIIAPSDLTENKDVYIQITANDNTYIKTIKLFWDNGSLKSKTWNNVLRQSFSQKHNIGKFRRNETITFYAEVTDTSGNVSRTNEKTITINPLYYTISGFVQSSIFSSRSSFPATMIFEGSGSTESTNKGYSHKVPEGWTGCITPDTSDSPYHWVKFVPPRQCFNNLSQNQSNINFRTQIDREYLKVSPLHMYVSGADQIKTIQIENIGWSDEMDWNVVSNSPWLSIVGNSSGSYNDQVTIHIQENDSNEVRVGSITVNAPDAITYYVPYTLENTKTVEIKQFKALTDVEEVKIIPEKGFNFGKSVDISENHAIVAGNIDDTGIVYIYERDGYSWKNIAELIPNEQHASFGKYVSISGKNAMVISNQFAYIYENIDESWMLQKTIELNANETSSIHGKNICISNKHAIVSKSFVSDNKRMFSTEIYQKYDSEWVLIDTLDKGGVVDMRNDFLIIGCPDINDDIESVFIYHLDGVDWKLQKTITRKSKTNFGKDVAILNEQALISDNNGVQAFTYNGSDWVSDQVLKAGKISNGFGENIQLSENYALISSPGDDARGTNTGALYVYKRNGAYWNRHKRITTSDKLNGQMVGKNCAIDNYYIIAGNPNYSSTGCVYIISDYIQATEQPFIEVSKEYQAIGASADQYIINVENIGTGNLYDNIYCSTNEPSWVHISKTSIDSDHLEVIINIDENNNNVSRKAYISINLNNSSETPKIIELDQVAGYEKRITHDDQIDAPYNFAHSVAIHNNYAFVTAVTDETIEVLGERGTIRIGEICTHAYLFENINNNWTIKKYFPKISTRRVDRGRPGGKPSIGGGKPGLGKGKPNLGGGKIDIIKIPSNQANQKDFRSTDYNSVAIFNNHYIVGIPYFSSAFTLNNNFAGVYSLNNNQIITSSNAKKDCFGNSVSVYNNDLMIGAYGDDENGSESGSIYVYQYINGQWQQHQKIVANDAMPGDQFGQSVALHHNFAIVTAKNKVYFLKKNGNQWNHHNVISTNENEFKLRCYSSSISENYAIAGFLSDLTHENKVYIYSKTNDEWNVQQVITNTNFNDSFARSVSISDKYALVGQFTKNYNNIEDSGVVYLYKLMNKKWEEVNQFVPFTSNAEDHFGISLSISDDLAIIGCPGHNNSAYIYSLPQLIGTPNKQINDNISESIIKPNCTPHDPSKFYDLYRSESSTLENAVKVSKWSVNMSFVDQNAEPGKDYYYFIKETSSVNGKHISTDKIVSIVENRLTPPQNVHATEGTALHHVNIAWDNVAGAKYYRIYRNTIDTLSGSISISNWQTNVSFADTTVVPGITYYYWVKAAVGQSDERSSDHSAMGTGWINLDVPKNLCASDGLFNNFVNLTWDSVDLAESYKIYRSIDNNLSTAASISNWITNTVFIDQNVRPGKIYYYWVQSSKDKNGSFGSNWSDSDSGWRKLSSPENIVATEGQYANRIYLSWPENDQQYFYKVFRSETNDPDTASELNNWQPVTNYVDKSVEPGTYYYWLKKAIDETGMHQSDFSTSISGSAMEKAQYQAIVSLYNSMNGDNWITNDNWLSEESPITNWYGLTIENGNVCEIDLHQNNLSGTIPPEIGHLKHLKKLRLFGNIISGELPDEICQLLKLVELNLHSNLFTGKIPDELGTLSHLEIIDIHENQFQEFPDISGLSALSELFIQQNYFAFEDIEANIHFSDIVHIYNPQYHIHEEENFTIIRGNEHLFSCKLEGKNNIYQWYKDGTLIQGATNNQYILTSANISDSGSYFCEIKNSMVPDLSLTSPVFHLNVKYEIPESEYKALVAFYQATNGDNWKNNTNWLTDAPVSTWHGLTVSDGHVSEIFLFANNLVGYIPSDIKLFTQLKSFSIRINNLKSPIPSEIGELIHLNTLHIDSNKHTGGIPDEIFRMKNLTFLSLEGNQLTGQIPYFINTLQNLNFLSLKSNKLTGTIPNSIGKLQNLSYLNLEGNQLSGKIPLEIGNLKNLGTLGLGTNQLTGTAPSSLGNLEQLKYLNICNNQLNGVLPIELLNLKRLQYVHLKDNYFNTLPDISIIPSLKVLHISNNNLHFKDIEPYLQTNINFQYSPQRNIGQKKDIINFKGESHTLNIPVEGENNIYQWYKNETPIPDSDNNSLTLTSLSPDDEGKYYCAVTNSIVNGLTIYSEPVALTIISLATEEEQQSLIALYNAFQGNQWINNDNWTNTNIPLSKWHGVTVSKGHVTSIVLPNNNLTGEIPPELWDLNYLQELILCNNQIQGQLSSKIENLSELVILNLMGNQLTGNMPEQIGSLLQLKELNIADNNFDGHIPSCLSNASNLMRIFVQNNSFIGAVSEKILALPNLTHAFFHNNYLDSFPEMNSTSSIDLKIQDNFFTFKDIEYNIDKLSENFVYYPQQKIDYFSFINVTEGESCDLTVSAYGTNNIYQWYKNGERLGNQNDRILFIDSVSIKDAGIYTCEITNSIASKLTLQRKPIYLDVIVEKGPDGDINNDGKICIKDLVLALQVLTNISIDAELNLHQVDMDGSRNFDMIDVIILMMRFTHD